MAICDGRSRHSPRSRGRETGTGTSVDWGCTAVAEGCGDARTEKGSDVFSPWTGKGMTVSPVLSLCLMMNIALGTKVLDYINLHS